MILFYLLLIFAIWFIFSFGVIWMLGIKICRISAWWNPKYRVQKYIEISNPKLARLLIEEYTGSNKYFNTNIPILYNQYYVNPYPNRLSLLGLIDYCMTAVLAAGYGVGVTAYFFFGWFNNPLIPAGAGLLMIHAVLFSVLKGWDSFPAKGELEVISREERKRRKAGLH